MDRTEWLVKMRRESEQRYDSIWAPLYGEKYGLYPNATHRQFIADFLHLLPPDSLILDAACGAGCYEPLLLEKGHSVVGIDQSQGMLTNARTRFPGVRYEKIGLQEMAFRMEFDGAICVDAMENVSPEDWPLVLGNFQRALKPSACLYFTVEMAAEEQIQQAFERAQRAGLPVVRGEIPDETVYHYYPSTAKVKDWLAAEGLHLLKEGEGDGYLHMLAQSSTRG